MIPGAVANCVGADLIHVAEAIGFTARFSGLICALLAASRHPVRLLKCPAYLIALMPPRLIIAFYPTQSAFSPSFRGGG